MMIEVLQEAAATVLVLVAVLLVATLYFAGMTNRLERPAQVAARSRRQANGRGAYLREDSRGRPHG